MLGCGGILLACTAWKWDGGIYEYMYTLRLTRRPLRQKLEHPILPTLHRLLHRRNLLLLRHLLEQKAFGGSC